MEHNHSLVANPKQMEIYSLPNTDFKILEQFKKTSTRSLRAFIVINTNIKQKYFIRVTMRSIFS